ncbi:hypothetical protein [Sphingomonas sp.]|uniref:hypothetical protein n=1 Tax=Sphingomonas sp. TaxID=28214 RepID=UPI0025E1DF5F|nr:hypothetical protein [Sphingomonas sp.]
MAKERTRQPKRQVKLRAPKTRKHIANEPKSLKSYKDRYIKRLNDLHVGTQITVTALIARQEQLERKNDQNSYHHFVVPSGGSRPEARIRRDKKQMASLLSRMAGQEEYGKSLMLAVSITEDYLANILKLMLRAYPERLERGLKNGPSDAEIHLGELLRKSKEEILEDWVRSRILSAIYASPSAYLRYTKHVLEIEIDQSVMFAFVEAKATRDVLVHSQGIVDQRYLEKATNRARAKTGEPITIDKSYFGSSLATMKALIMGIHDAVQHRYADEQAVIAQLPNFLK